MPKYKLKRNSYRKAQNRSNSTFESIHVIDKNVILSENNLISDSDISDDYHINNNPDTTSFSFSNCNSDIAIE